METSRTHVLWPLGGHKVAVPNDEPLWRAVVNPASRRQARLVGPSTGVAARYSEESGLALETASRGESQRERRQLEKLAQSVRLGAEDLPNGVP
jgi:hypothetical protein